MLAPQGAADPVPHSLRLAVWHGDFSRDGPGLLLRDLLSRRDPETETAIAQIRDWQADVLLLTRFDHDLRGVALSGLQARLAEQGLSYPHLVAPPQNRGLPSGIDLDGDGTLGTPEDMQGYGRFSGDGAMALLSRYPVEMVADYSGFLWRDLPEARTAEVPAEALGVQRLSSSAHWWLSVTMPDGGRLGLLAWSATPPIFGRGRRNADRNHDEAAFWLHLLDGALDLPKPSPPFVLMGHANRASWQGDGAAIADLEAHSAFGQGVRHPTVALAAWRAQLSVLLPSADISVLSKSKAMVQENGHSPLIAEILLPKTSQKEGPALDP